MKRAVNATEPKKASDTDFWKRYQRALKRKQYEVHMPLRSIQEFLTVLLRQGDDGP